MTRNKALKITLVSVAVIAVLLGGLYAFIVWEGSSAREDAPALEASIAQWLLHHTVPASFRAMKNPLSTAAGSPDVVRRARGVPQQVRAVSRLRRRRQDRDRQRPVSASPGSAQRRRPAHERRRAVLSHQERHPPYRHAGVGAPRPQDLASQRVPAQPAQGSRAFSADWRARNRSRRWPRRTTSAPQRARTATPRSTSAGRRRAWPTWCRIRARIRTRSFRISPNPIRWSTSPRTTSRSPTAADGSSATSSRSATTISCSPRSGT